MKKLLWLLAIVILIAGCSTKPVIYEMEAPPAFRMHDKTQKSTLVSADSFIVEDSESSNATKYTTTANIKTYMDTYYQPLEATLTDIADGTIAENLVNTTYPWAVTEGGTGSGNATGARTNLGAAASGANSDITSLAGLTTPLTVPQGGTGAATFTNGGILLGSGTGAITALGAATNGQIPIGDGTTDPVLATLTGTANEVTVTNGAGAITLSMATGVNATKIGDGTVSSTEYQYIGTLTSNAQDQLDARCLESVFGTAIGTGLLLDTATLKVSAILQKYHGVDPSTDVLTMLGSDNSTVILSNIGAEPALTDEDSLYSTLSDVSQFYEPGDNVTTAHGTSRPATCSVGQTFVDTDEDTDGLLCTCVAENTWKCGQSALSGDIISEDDSSVEVVDDNVTEQVVVTVSGTQIGLFDANGLDITGTINADGYEMDATASPRIRFLDSDCPGTDKFIGSIDYQYVDGADGAENGDIYIRSQEGGANTTQIQYDESDTSWEIPTGKNLVLDGGYVVGAARIGTEISANATLTTSQQRAIVYKASAACTVTLDAAADVGYGYIVGFKVKDASETLILRPEGGEIVNLHGTALAAGTGIQSPGNAGDFIFLMAVTDASGTTDGYETWGYGEEAWTSE